MKFNIVLFNAMTLGLLLLGWSCKQQNEFTETKKLQLLAKSWGLLKYYHPAIGSGEVNWDSVLVAHIDDIRLATSSDSFNAELEKMLGILPDIVPASSPAHCDHEDVEELVDFSWINSNELSGSNQQILNSALQGKVRFTNKFVSDSVGNRALSYVRFYEDPLEDANMGQVELRLLGLFRYWNIIAYFFPYKNLTDKNWDHVLEEYIPRFVQADNKEEYYEAVLLLSTEINDGHANIPYHHELRRAFFGSFTVPFSLRFVENRFVVEGIKSDSLGTLAQIQIGDIITKVDGKPISILSKELGKFLPKPNPAFHYSEISSYILNGKTDSVELKIQRGTEMLSKKIARYTFADIRKYRDKKQLEIWKMLEGNIAYAHMGELSLELLPEFFSTIQQTDGLILDFRHYPNWEILYEFLGHFYSELKPFVLLKSQCLDKPGSFYKHVSESDLSEIELKEFEYNSPIYILVDENTLSFGEYFVMAMQVLENVTVIGSQTAGEDGNQVGIEMPGGVRMFISSLGIYYPNGDNSQRDGIKIDEVVKPRIEDIRSGIDRPYEYALKKLKKVSSDD